MKNGLIVVANELKYNYAFIEYLKREIIKRVGELDATIFISKNDESISKYITESMSIYDNVIIATTDSFELIGKILSTKTSDILVYREDMLIPSKALCVNRDSYIVQNANILRVEEGKKIPKISIKEQKEVGVYLFADELEVKRFEKLAKIFEVDYLKIKYVDNLWYFTLSSRSDIGIDRLLNDVSRMITWKILIGNNLSSIISNILMESKKSITFAESCTGGLIASEFTKNSGVSSIFGGSIVSYANEVKENHLNVSHDIILRYGAVSKECVREMLDGVLDSFDADYAIAVSGIAGPDGGSIDKPVGTVIIGVKNREKNSIIKKISLQGDRVYIQKNTLYWALKLLVLYDEKFFFKFMLKSLDK